MTAPTIDRTDCATRLQQAAELAATVLADVAASRPDGLAIALSFAATVGVVVDALPMAVQALNEPLYVDPDGDVAALVDMSPVTYTFTAAQLAARDTYMWNDGWQARTDAPLTAPH